MGRTIMGGAVVSLDGYIAYDDDSVGPLFDWYGNGTVETDGRCGGPAVLRRNGTPATP